MRKLAVDGKQLQLNLSAFQLQKFQNFTLLFYKNQFIPTCNATFKALFKIYALLLSYNMNRQFIFV